MRKVMAVAVLAVLLGSCLPMVVSTTVAETPFGGSLGSPSSSYVTSYSGGDLPLEKDTIGTFDVLVLCIQFTDMAHAREISFIQDLFFNQTRAFLNENSYGKFDFIGNVSGWLNSSHPMDYYGADGSGIDDANGPPYKMVQEAVQLADPTIDFTDYDRDGNGRLDQLYVIHAGLPQETSGNSSHIWSHYNNELYVTVDGIEIADYACASDLSSIGVICHEFGHLLGLLDLYDTDGSSYEGGVGQWSIMSTGVHNDGGSKPAHFDAFSRIFLGWLEPTVVMSDLDDVPLDALEDTDEGSCYKIPIGSLSSPEYFLVDLRCEAPNETLYGEGVLIWHVDESVSGNNNDYHRMVEVEQADANNNPGEVGDIWRTGDIFSDSSHPNSRAYNGDKTNITIFDFGPVVGRSSSFSVIVSKSFHPPTISPIPDYVTPLNFKHGTVNLGAYGYDQDGDTINWTVEDGDTRLSLNITNNILFIDLIGSSHFITTLTLRLTDQEGLFVETTLNVSVLPFDQPPTVIIQAPFEVKIGTTVTISTVASHDIDDQIVHKQYLAEQNPTFTVRDIEGVSKDVQVSNASIGLGYIYYFYNNPIYLVGRVVENGTGWDMTNATFQTVKPSGQDAHTLTIIGENLDYFKFVNETWAYVTIENVSSIWTNDTSVGMDYGVPGNYTIMVIAWDTFNVSNYEMTNVIVHSTDYYTPALLLLNMQSFEVTTVGETFTLSFAFQANPNVAKIRITRQDTDPLLLIELYDASGLLIGVPQNFRQELLLTLPGPGEYSIAFTLSVETVGEFSHLVVLTPINSDGDVGENQEITLVYTINEPLEQNFFDILLNPYYQAGIIIVLALSVVGLLYWFRRRPPVPGSGKKVYFEQGPQGTVTIGPETPRRGW